MVNLIFKLKILILRVLIIFFSLIVSIILKDFVENTIIILILFIILEKLVLHLKANV